MANIDEYALRYPASEINDKLSLAHYHSNKSVIDKLSSIDGNLTFDGQLISGGTSPELEITGTIVSVNGISQQIWNADTKADLDENKKIKIEQIPSDLKIDLTEIESEIELLNTNKVNKNNVMLLDGTTMFTPTLANHPINKEYLDDEINIINDITSNLTETINYTTLNLTTKANTNNVILLDGTTVFTPVAPNHPTNKKYIDEKIDDVNNSVNTVLLDLSYKANKNNVILLDNTTVFTPTLLNHPTNKRYVDEEISNLDSKINEITDSFNNLLVSLIRGEF